MWEICDSCMQYDPEKRSTFAQIADKMEDLRIRAPVRAPTPSPPPSPPISDTSYASYGHPYASYGHQYASYGHPSVNDQPSAWKLFKRRIQGKNS